MNVEENYTESETSKVKKGQQFEHCQKSMILFSYYIGIFYY